LKSFIHFISHSTAQPLSTAWYIPQLIDYVYMSHCVLWPLVGWQERHPVYKKSVPLMLKGTFLQQVD